MLGETDASHIIRTIEYWDLERRRWPKRPHTAVLVAENMERRFFNVIQLLTFTIPIGTSEGPAGRDGAQTALGTADLQLVLAGRHGWLYHELFTQVSRLGLAGRVVFTGYVDEDDLPALYGGALALVYPSLYEGFGMPVLEAQSCGVPVMTSNNSSLPEIAGDSALLVDPHDVDAIAAAMHRILTDEGLRQELIRRGFDNVQRFSWEKCARETLAVLEEVAASAQRGATRGGSHGA